MEMCSARTFFPMDDKAQPASAPAAPAAELTSVPDCPGVDTGKSIGGSLATSAVSGYDGVRVREPSVRAKMRTIVAA